jgi:hypothetical protein
MADLDYTPHQREAYCLWCNELFRFEHSTGRLRQYCGDECIGAARRATTAARSAGLPRCSVPGCGGHAVRVSYGLREKHYGRRRRGVPMDDRDPASYRYKTAAGYIVRAVSNHPVAQGGRAYEHRCVVYEKHGGVCPPCFWCGSALDWASAVVDHLDEVKHHNHPDNLVVACNLCNRARGSILPFLKRLRQEGLAEFISQASKYHAKIMAEAVRRQ